MSAPTKVRSGAERPGYGGGPMVQTPWGDGSELAARKLSPGRGVPAEEVERSQRERLYGAMVVSVAERGFEQTSVANLVALSGVSRRTFYGFFADKQACFVATIETLLEAGIGLASRRFEQGSSWEERAEHAVAAILELCAAQPAAARICFVEVYAAGPAAMAPLEAALEQVAELAIRMLEQNPERRGIPAELVRALVGGLHRVAYRHLSAGEEAKLAELGPAIVEWVLSYEPPPGSLRARARRGAEEAAGAPPFAAHIPAERILRGFAMAVSEQGYRETTIAQIAAAARISQATFYANFSSKEDALEAALDTSGAQMVAATLPAVRRTAQWGEAVHTALVSMFAFFAAEPAFARLRAIEVYAAGPRAVELRNETTREVIGGASERGIEPPRRSRLVFEATFGALDALLYERVRGPGPESLPEAVPLATYIALAPFLGGAAAYEASCL
jgi:AcrR family transcriptional regulator